MVEKDKEKKQLPWFLYLQGGPGMSCRSPSSYNWIQPVLEKGFQVLFLMSSTLASFSELSFTNFRCSFLTKEGQG